MSTKLLPCPFCGAPAKIYAEVEHHVDQLLGSLANDERNEVVSLGVKIAVADGHFRSLQLDLAFARRILKAKADLSVCEAVKAAHRKTLPKTALN